MTSSTPSSCRYQEVPPPQPSASTLIDTDMKAPFPGCDVSLATERPGTTVTALKQDLNGGGGGFEPNERSALKGPHR